MHQFPQTTSERSHLMIEIIGWVGVGLIVLAYLFISFTDINTGLYQIMNLVGSLGIIIHSVSKKDYQPVILNVVWVLIAIFALVSIAR